MTTKLVQPQGSLVERVKLIAGLYHEFEIRKIAELAPGVICVYDNYNEYDIYFDLSAWEPKDGRRHWEADSGFVGREMCKATNVGIYQGPGFWHSPRNFEDALKIAMQMLTPRSSAYAFHSAPQRKE